MSQCYQEPDSGFLYHHLQLCLPVSIAAWSQNSCHSSKYYSFIHLHPKQSGKCSSQPFIREKKKIRNLPLGTLTPPSIPHLVSLDRTRSKAHSKADQLTFLIHPLQLEGGPIFCSMWSSTRKMSSIIQGRYQRLKILWAHSLVKN